MGYGRQANTEMKGRNPLMGLGQGSKSPPAELWSGDSLKPRLHDTICCQTGCQASWTTNCIMYTNIQHSTNIHDNRLYRVCSRLYNPV